MLRYFLPLFSMLILQGCTISGFYEADPLFKQPTDLLEEEVDIVDPAKLKTRITSISKAEDPENQALRNELLDELISISNRICARHQASIIAGLNTWNVASGTTSTLLSSIGSVVGDDVTKSALAAGAAFSNSTRSLVNEEIYAKALGTTIVRATMSAREQQLAVLNNEMKKPYENFSIHKGLHQVYDYHNRCSFYYGMLEVTKALEERRPSQAEILDRLTMLRTQSADLADKEMINKRIEALVLELETAPK